MRPEIGYPVSNWSQVANIPPIPAWRVPCFVLVAQPWPLYTIHFLSLFLSELWDLFLVLCDSIPTKSSCKYLIWWWSQFKHWTRVFWEARVRCHGTGEQKQKSEGNLRATASITPECARWATCLIHTSTLSTLHHHYPTVPSTGRDPEMEGALSPNLYCLLQGTLDLGVVNKRVERSKWSTLADWRWSQEGHQTVYLLLNIRSQEQAPQEPPSHTIHKGSNTCSLSQGKMEQVFQPLPSWPFTLDNPACRFHGVAPSLGPVMPNPAKEKSPEEL